ncbi:hypothetical protein LX32DRAFT_605343 [Colletotrichum zoysiae]|uniref:Uncharacterized protein n=1 Tax=Colletotrichum zoysiae TaxID=1216348 RepID=A0AAD9LWP7_9PEZI|nr:hypothetical protein LX32DRAFT_605343 [Colletotrichum zoysiae]
MLPPFFLVLFGGILLIAAQAEDAPTLKSLGSLPTLRISRSGLPVNSAAVNGACDARSVRCNGRCVPLGSNCCPGETCTADGVCSGRADHAPDCDPGTAACGSRCMPTDAVCCDDGSYCDAGETCVEGGSCRGSTTPNMPQATTAGLGATMSASAGAPRGAYVNHAALAVGLCAAVPLVI